MRFRHQQSGIYQYEVNGRYYVFLRWENADNKHFYQHVDFTTLAEASCFLSGAISACQVCRKAVRFDVLTPKQYSARRKKKV